ncbi:unnamed protein product [Protopolystoma xenopodis]|uniref:Uncharacterized protein n=1 Tax=Protopolystoma xenopodis TaxID=117903 RepID=A0A448WK17_9PLAT|nr:unnamed protein product [Protopolystoma xenopodis]
MHCRGSKNGGKLDKNASSQHQSAFSSLSLACLSDVVSSQPDDFVSSTRTGFAHTIVHCPLDVAVPSLSSPLPSAQRPARLRRQWHRRSLIQASFGELCCAWRRRLEVQLQAEEKKTKEENMKHD